jgi:hypothetical protein
MTEFELARLEAWINTPAGEAGQIADEALLALGAVPRLIAEIRRLRSMRALAVTIPPEPSEAEGEGISAEQVQAIVRDIGEIIDECCVEGTGFLLTIFDTRGDYEPVYTFNAGRGDTLNALRRVTELVERS